MKRVSATVICGYYNGSQKPFIHSRTMFCQSKTIQVIFPQFGLPIIVFEVLIHEVHINKNVIVGIFHLRIIPCFHLLYF